MLALAGPLFMFAALVVISGMQKLAEPAGATRALSAIGLPANVNVGRALGAAELATGIWVLAFGGRAAALTLALLYAAFAAFVVVGMRSSKIKSCGCFGSQDTPPSTLHLMIDLAAVATAAIMTVQPVGDIVDVMGETPWAGIPFLMLVVLGAWLTLLALALLPALSGATKRLQST